MNAKESFIIEGLAGERKLKGAVSINGAKNAALKAVAASVLFDGPITLKNVPHTSDMETIATILEGLGAKIDRKENGAQTLTIDPSTITGTDIDPDLAKGMRASVVLTGPLLGRFGKVSFPAPGGCVIGARPIDLFLAGYKKMGATVTETETLYEIKSGGTLASTEIFFNKITVGGTETLMMAAVLAKGKTILKNCAMEPEIVNVAEWLIACGAKISGVGTPTIEIEGTNGTLLSPKVPYVAIPDRIEAGSYLILGALCAQELSIENCEPKHMGSVIEILTEAGVSLDVGTHSITVHGHTTNGHLRSIPNIHTHEYPGFPTDLQAPLVTFLTQTEGESIIFETIFEGRFKYTEDLSKMGANITVMNPREILIKGPTALSELSADEELTAHDIRAGFAVVLAALIGKGKTTVSNVHLIDRGYENIEGKLKGLGAHIERVSR